MSLSIGIVGLPNVGKSTLFNAMLKTQMAQAANHPFTTIEPNIGIVEVPDERLFQLHKIIVSQKPEIQNPPKIIPTTIKFVDIAGLIKGASKGEGLGNKFLANIRETDAILIVVRVFENENIIHVSGKINPREDIETIQTELDLADLEIEEKFKDRPETPPKLFKQIPKLYVANCSEEQMKSGAWQENWPRELLNQTIAISAQVESELAELNDDEQIEFLKEMNLTEPGLNRLIKDSYKLLNLITFFTAGPKEVRAWTCANGSKAPEAAGKIHTDFEKGFIRAEIIGYDDYLKYDGEAGSKNAGKLRIEGKDYIVRDGDIVHFRFSN